MSNMLDQLVGGIPIPMILGMGTGVDLETTVADLLRVGALGGGLLSGIGSLASGLANNSNGLKGVLSALGVQSQANSIQRGSGLSAQNLLALGGLLQTTSQVSYIGNAAGNDVESSVMSGAEDEKNRLLVENQEKNDSKDIKLEDVNNTSIKILELLQTVIINGRLRTRTEFETGNLNIPGFGM